MSGLFHFLEALDFTPHLRNKSLDTVIAGVRDEDAVLCVDGDAAVGNIVVLNLD